MADSQGRVLLTLTDPHLDNFLKQNELNIEVHSVDHIMYRRGVLTACGEVATSICI